MLEILAALILIGLIVYGVWAIVYILGGRYAGDRLLDRVLGR